MPKLTKAQIEMDIAAALREPSEPDYTRPTYQPYHGPSEDYQRICTTCQGNPERPFRRWHGGKIVEGCIDAIHTGHLYGSSKRWHDRPSAKKFRKDAKKRMDEMLRVPSYRR